MAMGKYELDSLETRCQPGSNDTVITNRLGITDVREMDRTCYLNPGAANILLWQFIPAIPTHSQSLRPGFYYQR